MSARLTREKDFIAGEKSRVGANQRDGTLLNTAREWRRFDALPAEFRRLVAFAPYDFEVPVRKWTPDGWVKRVFEIRDAEIRKTYGPDHPQIGDRTPERRPQKSARR